ncbi:GIY-YIG nuclease family protein, partial [Mycolicibacillus trivialis]
MDRDELIDRYLVAVPHSHSDVFMRPSPIPAEPGVYGWWFRRLPAAIDVSRCERQGDLTLLYAGISPSRPPANGKPASRQNIRKRVTYHFRGNAEGSTLRKTLGCLLAEGLGIELRRVGSGTRRTFGAGEALLSQWMADNALISWITVTEPWVLECELFNTLDLPLNLQGNTHNSFYG